MTRSDIKMNRAYKIKLVIAGFIALVLSTGILINSMGQFILPIHEDTGYSVGAVSLAFSIICAGVIFAATFMAKFIDRYNPRICMAISAGILSGFALIISFTTELWQFYVCTAVIGLAFTGLHTLPVSVMINNAFSEKRKGLAISLAFAGSGIGGMIFNPIFNRLIDSYGWRTGFIVIAIVYLIGGLVIVLLVRAPKTNIDEAEYMEIEVSESYAVDTSENISDNDFGYKEAIGTRAFKFLVIGMMLVNGTSSTTMMHSVPYMVDIGISSSRASLFISICLLVLAVYKILLGILCDKYGIRKGATLGVTCSICGMIIMITLQASSWIYILFLLVGSMGLAAPTVTAPLMVSHLFGNKSYTRIFGATVIFTGIGNSALPTLMGYIFDFTGSYIPGWILLTVLLILALILYTFNFRNPPVKS